MTLFFRRPGEGRLALALAGLLLLGTAWFTYAWPGFWNTNEYSRVFLTRSLSERGELAINREIALHYTQDSSYREGNFYANKAPGMSVLASGPYLLVRLVEQMSGWCLAEPGLLYVLRLFTVTLPSAAFLAFLFLFWGSLGAPLGLRTALAVALGAGSLAFPYASLFYGHYPAGILLFLSFVLLRGERPAADLPAGLLAGLAVLVEYPALPAVLCLGGYRLLRSRPVRGVLLFGAGLVGPLVLLGFYQQACFGGVFQVPYLHETYQPFFSAHARGVAGVTFPSVESLLGLTFSPYRGVFFYFPWLAAGAVSLAWMVVSSRWRREGLLFAALTLAYLYVTSAFSDWEGGWSMGARHLTPLMPFWVTAGVLGLGRLRPRLRRRAVVVLAPLSLIGVFQAWGGAATFPYFPRAFSFPLQQFVLPLWRRGLFAPSWGNILGLSGFAAAVPSALAVAILAVFMLRGYLAYAALTGKASLLLVAWALAVSALLLMGAEAWSRSRSGQETENAARAAEMARIEDYVTGGEAVIGEDLTAPGR